MYKETDLAWAAGIVDGEGGTQRAKDNSNKQRKYYSFRLRVTQSNNIKEPPEMLIRFKDIFGIGNIYMKPRRGNRTYSYHYDICGDKAKQILQLIWPYLGTVKRKQAYSFGFRLTTWEIGMEDQIKHWERSSKKE